MSKKYFCISLGAVLALAIVFGGVLGNPFLIKDVSASSTVGPSVTFSYDGGTEDLGVTTYVMVPRTWTVEIPGNYEKVETTHYDKPTPDTVKKYMGWNGYVEVNGEKLWNFLSWSSVTGGVIYDYALDSQVSESSGSGKWIDATEFFQAGENTVKYYHYTGGDGIGMKIRVTVIGDGEPEEPTTPTLKADGGQCSSASECESTYCVNGYCRSSSTYCGDGVCDTGEDYFSCSADCEQQLTANSGACDIASECDSGYCVHGICRSAGVYCGDKYCDSNENCSNCIGDCGLCGSVSLGTYKSSSTGILAYAYSWSWSRDRNQDGRYGEAKLTFSQSLPPAIGSAKLLLSSSYSQMAGSATAEVYIKTIKQVTAKDSDHDRGVYWYGDDASLGEKVSSFVLNYSGGSEEFDVTSYIDSNRADTYYIAVKNLATADIGLSKIQLTVTEGVVKKADGEICYTASDCIGGYCMDSICRSSSVYCGNDVCDTGETCFSCSGDCGACAPLKPTILTFTKDEVKDAGVVHYSEGVYTWMVNLPSNFLIVETTHYDKPDADGVKKYQHRVLKLWLPGE